VDLHVHGDPSMVVRSVDAIQVAEAASAVGMRAVVIKDHQSPMEPAAWLAQRHAKITPPFEIFGSTLLNGANGGYNVLAVDRSLIMGGRMIMAPTLATPAHFARRVAPGRLSSNKMQTKSATMKERVIRTLDDNGRLLPEVLEVLDRLATSDTILATGHLDQREAWALIRAARERGHRRFSLTHALEFIHVTPEELREFCRETGAFAEYTTHQLRNDKMDGTDSVVIMRRIGVEHIHYSSDAGYIEVPKPVDGHAEGIEVLLQLGLTERELVQIAHTNPANLLGVA